VNLNAMNDPDFTGVPSGGSPGFGGVDTGFSHSGSVHGGIETQPHDWVHGLVGGARDNDRQFPGAMSVPSSAGLDPIFWLHHANLDRLWQVWNLHPPAHVDPTEPKWINGPGSIGERTFQMPMPDATTWTYTPQTVADLGQLGYTYDDLSAAPSPRRARRRTPRAAAEVQRGGAAAVASPDNVEMVGANEETVQVRGTDVRTDVRIDAAARGKVVASLSNEAADALEVTQPDRVFLNLENVRGRNDATAFHVYVGLSEEESAADHPDRLAGSIALFGVREASEAGGELAGQGLTYVLDISRIVDDLHVQDSFDVDRLPVRIVPTNPVAEDAQVSIGRISIFRQGR
jgi:tyrosinase